jgi:ferrous iron transport protein B
VVDATNLERNLYLTLQILERDKPVIIALNMWDDTKHRGIKIDLGKLQELLGVPVIPTAAITGEGIKELVESLHKATSPDMPLRSREERWKAIGDIVEQVQRISHRHHTFFERLADASVKPLSGIPIAMAILGFSFFIIRFIGEGLINYVLDPLFNNLWSPVVLKFSELLESSGFLHNILIGSIDNGAINYTESFGLLTSGLYVPFAMVMPYIISFYFLLGILEDSGYLPRLAVLMDNVMHRLGLHGYAIIPNLLGLGCNVPAVMATRALESQRERFIAATLISIAVPCAALQAMIFGLVGEHGIQYVAMVYGTLFIVWIVLGVIMNRFAKGYSPELLIEVPPYRKPPWRTMMRKLWMRVRGFIREAVPIILGAILVINLLNMIGVFEAIANFTAPVVTGILGLPKEAVTALVIGFLRKDAALGMLAPLAMTAQQLVIASVALAMLFPCIATFVVFLRELGAKNLVRSLAIMIVAALITGGILNLILQ